jgi:NDP-sugar pyrophosphorylase family protein
LQGIILAAGRSTRTQPLTLNRPKSLLPLVGKPIIEHTLLGLSPLVEEIIVVVGFGAQDIRAYLGDNFRGVPLRYAVQKDLQGSGDALLTAGELIKGDFLLAAGDDYYPPDDFRHAAEEPHSIVCRRFRETERFGVVEVERGILAGFAEKPKNTEDGLVNTSLYHLEPDILPLVGALPLSERGEIELTKALPEYSHRVGLSVVESEGWLPIGYPWDLLTASEALGGGDERGWIDADAQIDPQAAIKNCIVMACAKVSAQVEMANSIIGCGAIVEEGVKVHDLPPPEKGTVFSQVKGIMLNTHRARFGCVLGDGAIVGEEAMLASGVKVWPRLRIPPGVMVSEDVTQQELAI